MNAPIENTPDGVLLSMLENLEAGEYDASLEFIFDQCRDRQAAIRAAKARANLLTLKEGTRVRLVNLRPKYLSGYTGTICPLPEWARERSRANGSIAVDLGQKIGRYGPIVVAGAACVTPIED